MKKILVVALMVSAGVANAQHRHHGYHPGYHRGHYNWVAPMIAGAVIGGAVVYTQRQYAQPSSVYVEKMPVNQVVCGSWVEKIDQDGNVSRERICYQQ
jgi:hypothetical protein